MTPEGRVKKEIKDYLKSIGAYQFWPVQTGYGAATLDCLSCIKGKFFGIEVKAPGKEATPRQLLTMKAMGSAGAAVICTDNLEELKRHIHGIVSYGP